MEIKRKVSAVVPLTCALVERPSTISGGTYNEIISLFSRGVEPLMRQRYYKNKWTLFVVAAYATVPKSISAWFGNQRERKETIARVSGKGSTCKPANCAMSGPASVKPERSNFLPHRERHCRPAVGRIT